MYLPVEHIPNVVTTYIEEELLPKATLPQKWATIFLGGAVARQAQLFVEDNKKLFETVEVLFDEGIDIEAVKELAAHAFEKTGPLEIMGVILNKDDVDILYRIAKKYSKE